MIDRLLEEFLDAEIPREAPLHGKVDVKVARVLAFYISARCGEDGVNDLASCVVELERMGMKIPSGRENPAEFVRSAIAFLKDEQRGRAALDRVLNGATAEEATRDVA